ncbi:hypothetical protein [Nonomuraea sp. NPDC049400]|uniref:hypothetical protein n=1 Tax=Nonomuraea sp. NPDC049400 TaxID=3364352 RepID=UPI003789FE6F
MSATLVIKFTIMGGVTYATARTGAQGAAARAILTSLKGFLELAAFAVAQAVTPKIAKAASPGEPADQPSGRDDPATGVLTARSCCSCSARWLGVYTSDAAVLPLTFARLLLLSAYALANSGIVMSWSLMRLKGEPATLGSAIAGTGMPA